jgi:hypothetical protein
VRCPALRSRVGWGVFLLKRLAIGTPAIRLLSLVDVAATVECRDNIFNSPRTQTADIATQITREKLAKSGFLAVPRAGIEPNGHLPMREPAGSLASREAAKQKSAGSL